MNSEQKSKIRLPMKTCTVLKNILTILMILGFLLVETASAQLPRERVTADPKIDRLFWAPSHIGISTVENIPGGNLNTSVKHTFGLVDGGIDRFFGLDDGANTRLGVEYGFHDRFSMGLGRMTFNKLVDIHAKYNVLHQTVSGSTPLDLAVKTSVGINTFPGTGRDFSERLNYFVSVMIARNMGRISLQATPMFTRFNHVSGNNENQLFGLGILANLTLNDRFSLGAEYLPVIGDRNPGTYDAAGITLNIDTGGHIFQLFFTSSQWHNEPFIMANNRDRFWEGEFRFGFNIHRVFGLR
jgi:hypothetical protein